MKLSNFFFCCAPSHNEQELVPFARRSEYTEPAPQPFTLNSKQKALVASVALGILTFLSSLLIYEDWEDEQRCEKTTGSTSSEKCADFDFRYHGAIILTATLAILTAVAIAYPIVLTCVQEYQDRRRGNLRINATQSEVAASNTFDL